MTKGQLFEFISTHKVAVLGGVSPEGGPQSALVGNAIEEQECSEASER